MAIQPRKQLSLPESRDLPGRWGDSQDRRSARGALDGIPDTYCQEPSPSTNGQGRQFPLLSGLPHQLPGLPHVMTSSWHTRAPAGPSLSQHHKVIAPMHPGQGGDAGVRPGQVQRAPPLTRAGLPALVLNPSLAAGCPTTAQAIPLLHPGTSQRRAQWGQPDTRYKGPRAAQRPWLKTRGCLEGSSCSFGWGPEPDKHVCSIQGRRHHRWLLWTPQARREAPSSPCSLGEESRAPCLSLQIPGHQPHTCCH